MWRYHQGWFRNFFYEKRFGVFIGTSSRACGNLKDPKLFSKALQKLNLPVHSYKKGQQVHGSRVGFAKSQKGPEIFPATDGIITNKKGLLLQVYTADCVPVFIVDPLARAIGLVHAGWKGVYKEILGRAVQRMKNQFGSCPKDIFISLGPHIQSQSYAVGWDVAQFFSGYSGVFKPKKPLVKRKQDQKFYLNLARCLKQQAQKQGIPPSHFTSVSHCSLRDRRCFSYRREKTEKRMVSLLLIK